MLETHGFTPPRVDAIQEWLSSLGITTVSSTMGKFMTKTSLLDTIIWTLK